MRNALHQAAVADEHVGPVIDDRVPGAVEACGQQSLRERHADRVGEALPERPGGGLDTGGEAVLRMSGRLRVELAEAASAPRWANRSRSGATGRTAASIRARSTARNGRDRASAGAPDGGAARRATAPGRSPPCPSAFPDARSSPPPPHPSPAPARHWQASIRKRHSMRGGRRATVIHGRRGGRSRVAWAIPRNKGLSSASRRPLSWNDRGFG